MQLHPLIPDHRLPAALKRPLVFGDPEQIAALRELEPIVRRIEEREAAIAAGKLRKWRVCVERVQTDEVTVEATCQDEAEELAMGEADFDCCFDEETEICWSHEIIEEEE
ncbi:MAG: hypothetical protein M0P69_05945 [Bacteroidales bacterium]|nr:hypothetical protein [Bacteroidales bacterium]